MSEPPPQDRVSIFAPKNGNGDVDPASLSGKGMDRTVKKRKWPPRRIAMVAGIVLFVLLVGYGFYTTTGGSRLNVDTDRITISTVSEGLFQEYIIVNGNVEPIRTVYLDAVEGGRVEERFIEEGTMVEEGDPIVRLTNNRIQLDLISREGQLYETINYLRQARLQQEENSLRLLQQMAEIDYQIDVLERQNARNERLWEKKLIAEIDYEESRDNLAYQRRRRELTLLSYQQDSLQRVAQINQLESNVSQMQQNLGLIRENLENLIVRAPISGQLTSLNAEIGESIGAGQRLGQIDKIDAYKLSVPIDEFYLPRIARGQTGTAVVAGDSIRMSITKVYPEVQNGQFEVDMNFVDGDPQGIRRGQTIRVNVNLGDLEQAVLIPKGGFYQTTGGNWIYVVDPSGDYAERRPIRIGRQNSQYYEVLEGLAPGERAVTSSYDTFGDVDRLVFQN